MKTAFLLMAQYDGLAVIPVERGGLDIPRVALVTGHRGWSSLQRYSHIRQYGDKYEGWKWKR